METELILNKHVETVRCERKFDRGFYYTFTLSCSESRNVSSYGLKLYSVEVTLRNPEGVITNSSSGDIFARLSEAEDFFELVVRNLVTPIDLPYVISDELE